MKYSNSCRICLGENAVYPLFSKVEDEDGGSVLRKFSKCLKENIEDIKGYPCNICGSCKNTLDIIYEFVNKYKESCRILSLVSIVKEEHDIDFESSYDNDVEHDIPQDEIEIYIDDIKEEPKIEYELNKETKSLERILKPLRKQLKITKVTGQKIKKSGRKKVAKKDKTNKIASSLLEGTCSWNGEKWCSRSRKATSETTKKFHTNQQTKENLKNLKKIDENVINKESRKTTINVLCDVCGEIIEFPNNLSKHKRKVHNKLSQKCDECGRVCSSISELKRHTKRKHSQEKNHFCPICKGAFAFMGDVTTHIKSVHEKHNKTKKKLKCKFCEKSFFSPQWAKAHERAVHTGERPDVCSVCGARFTNKMYLREHMRLHTGEKPFKCPICGQGYAQSGNMKSHIAHNHNLLSDKTPHANRVHRICKKREFKVVKKEVPKEKKIPPPKLCDLCGDVFKTQDKLRKHKLKIHFKKPAKCEQCGRVCSSDRELNKHIKRRHLILEKNFVCATCGNRFAFKGELTNHCRKIHDRQTPKKKFTCKFCDKKYSCAKMVLIHERAVHTGERPAVCTVCNHSFTHEDYLKEHMRLHTGETPFKCPICGRGYAQRGNMKSHMIHNHKISDLDSVTLANLKPSYLKYLKPC